MANALGRTILNICTKKLNTITPSLKFSTKNSYKVAALPVKGNTFEIQNKERPKLEKNQVRIQVQYCSVNSIDCQAFMKQSESTKQAIVPGYELSGEVIEVGKSVTNEQIIVGDRVVALSLDKWGGFAEQCIVDVTDVWRIPGNLKVKEAALLPCAHSTAVFTFSKLCCIKEGSTVLVSAGAGGLGLAAIDVAANIYKAQVIAVVDTEGTGELSREEGAFKTLKFSPNINKSVLKMTSNKGCDVVYDAVAQHMLSSLSSCVKLRGDVFVAAPFSFKEIPAPPPNTHMTIVSLHELRKQNLELYRTMVSDTLQLANDGLISPYLSAKFPLDKINDAVKFINEKKCTGKVLLEIDD